MWHKQPGTGHGLLTFATIEALSKSAGETVSFGLPATALALTALPIALSRGQYLALFEEGAHSVDAVKALDWDTLTRYVGATAAKAITESASNP